jgi:hypothetical protein
VCKLKLYKKISPENWLSIPLPGASSISSIILHPIPTKSELVGQMSVYNLMMDEERQETNLPEVNNSP